MLPSSSSEIPGQRFFQGFPLDLRRGHQGPRTLPELRSRGEAAGPRGGTRSSGGAEVALGLAERPLVWYGLTGKTAGHQHCTCIGSIEQQRCVPNSPSGSVTRLDRTGHLRATNVRKAPFHARLPRATSLETHLRIFYKLGIPTCHHPHVDSMLSPAKTQKP